jgi:hypothetical protein
VSAGAARPGPPPLPPADLPTRPLPIHTLAAGTRLYRIHRGKYDPLHFGRSSEPAARSRWDAPDGSYGVCYLAEADHIAFAETYLRQSPTRYIVSSQLKPKSLVTLRATRALRFVRMHGSGLAKLGATLTVVAGGYATCQAWSLAIYAHPATPLVDGISYRAAHDDGLAIALFERTASAVEEIQKLELLDPCMADTLAAWFDRYEVGLI